MRAAGVGFVLVYIDEAHSTLWPVGLALTPPPQVNARDRLRRAREFAAAHDVGDAFRIVADGAGDAFAETFRAWPDKFLRLDAALRVTAMSTYGARADALIDVDCLELLEATV